PGDPHTEKSRIHRTDAAVGPESLLVFAARDLPDHPQGGRGDNAESLRPQGPTDARSRGASRAGQPPDARAVATAPDLARALALEPGPQGVEHTPGRRSGRLGAAVEAHRPRRSPAAPSASTASSGAEPGTAERESFQRHGQDPDRRASVPS